MPFTTQETLWMRRALRLAAQGFTPPNPRVGCLIVREGKIVGEGFHPFAGQPHAEVFALREAAERARGATAYVTLEPCCHQGRTPPCTEALIAAGVRRVVVATLDPHVRVAGKGIKQLQLAKIETEIGLLRDESRHLIEDFVHFHTTNTPFLTLKAAMTLDGKTATASGDSQWITGEKARRHVHALRAQSGAVMVGIGTLLQDDAKLTARLPRRELPRQPLRIVVDSRLRTPPSCQAVRIAEASPLKTPLLIATTEGASLEREASLQRGGVEVLRLPQSAEGQVDLRSLFRVLAERQIISVFSEGGGTLNAALLEAGLAQKVLFFIAPKLLGGRDARTPLEGRGTSRMAEAVALERTRLRRFGEDFAMEGYLPQTKG